MSNSGMNLCMGLVIVLSLILMVMGFADIFYKKPGDGKTELNVISRQIRGIGLLVLASVVMALGTAMCVGGFVEKGNISGSLDF